GRLRARHLAPVPASNLALTFPATGPKRITMAFRVVLGSLSLLALTWSFGVGPVTARTTGCDDVIAARTSGMTVDQVKVALGTTAGKVAACDQVATIRARVEAHHERAEAYRDMLRQRFEQ